jgi:hypothetical protein
MRERERERERDSSSYRREKKALKNQRKEIHTKLRPTPGSMSMT